MQIKRYTRTAMAFHWLIALLILANAAMVWIVGYLPDGMVRPVIDTHKSLGITVLGLLPSCGFYGPERTIRRALAPLLFHAWERWSRPCGPLGALCSDLPCLPLSGWAHDYGLEGSGGASDAIFTGSGLCHGPVSAG